VSALATILRRDLAQMPFGQAGERLAPFAFGQLRHGPRASPLLVAHPSLA
jgi:hypothetical protein